MASAKAKPDYSIADEMKKGPERPAVAVRPVIDQPFAGYFFKGQIGTCVALAYQPSDP